MRNQSTPTRLALVGLIALFTAGCAAPTGDYAEPEHLAATVSYRRMAEGLFALLRASNDAYLNETMSTQGEDATPPNQETSPPSHAAFLRQTATEIATKGAEFSFALRSPHPATPLSAPQTQVEEDALSSLAEHPEEPIFTDETLGGRAYFTAVFPQRATSRACLDCHADSPRASESTPRKGDLLGVLVIRIPKEF